MQKEAPMPPGSACSPPRLSQQTGIAANFCVLDTEVTMKSKPPLTHNKGWADPRAVNMYGGPRRNLKNADKEMHRGDSQGAYRGLGAGRPWVQSGFPSSAPSSGLTLQGTLCLALIGCLHCPEIGAKFVCKFLSCLLRKVLCVAQASL